MISRYSFTALLLLMLGLHSDPARALCWTLPDKNSYVKMPDIHFTDAAPAPIGSPLRSAWTILSNEQRGYCDPRGTFRLVVTDEGGLRPGNGPGRYQTGIPGVELEIGFGYQRNNAIDMYAGWEAVGR